MGGLHLIFSDQRLNYIGFCVFEEGGSSVYCSQIQDPTSLNVEVPSTRYLVPSTRYLAPSTKYLVPSIMILIVIMIKIVIKIMIKIKIMTMMIEINAAKCC